MATHANYFNPAAVHDGAVTPAYWTSGQITMLAVTTDYDASTEVEDNQFLIDVISGDRIGEAVLPTPTVVGAVFSGGDLVIPSAAGKELLGYWFYNDTGDEATSRLVLWVGWNADGTQVHGTTDDAGISVPFSPSGIFAVATVAL